MLVLKLWCTAPPEVSPPSPERKETVEELSEFPQGLLCSGRIEQRRRFGVVCGGNRIPSQGLTLSLIYNGRGRVQGSCGI
jgi:hypothetical protein